MDLLAPEFRTKLDAVLATCAERGYDMRPYFTRRHPSEQAMFWRQSRSTQQVNAAITKLTENDAPWLAGVLRDVGPQHGRWATNALPGQSWHQWDEAVDCYRLLDGEAVWDSAHYKIYATVARDAGLEAGFFWQSRDSVHVQYRSGRVLDTYSWAEIDERMRAKFGGDALTT